MTKLTSVLAIAFMVNSIVLTTIKSREARKSLFDNEAPIAAPLNSDVEALDQKGTEVPATEATSPTAAPAAKNEVPAATAPAEPKKN